MLGRRRERGDTIIEVLLAFTVFSMIAVGAVTLMNSGTQSAQKALEITLVRQQIDAQAETLRFIHQKALNQTGSAYADTWRTLTTGEDDEGLAAQSVSKHELKAGGLCPDRPDRTAFILDSNTITARTDAFADDTDPSELPYAHVYHHEVGDGITATGIWVEAQRTEANYVDFYIKACWNAPGSGPATLLGTIVRLYAPN